MGLKKGFKKISAIRCEDYGDNDKEFGRKHCVLESLDNNTKKEVLVNIVSVEENSGISMRGSKTIISNIYNMDCEIQPRGKGRTALVCRRK